MRTCNTRKLVCTFVAIVGALSVIGTGFSLWFFISEEDQSSGHIDIPIVATSEARYGYFDENSLKATGDWNEAKKGYIFPSSLVFDEGHGTANKLDTGLNFYKRVNLVNDKTPGEGKDNIFVNQPYIADNVIVDFYESEISNKDPNLASRKLKLTLEITVSSKLAEAINILDKFPNINGLNYEVGKPLVHKYDFTNLCGELVQNVDLPKHMSSFSNNKFILHRYNLDLSTIFKYRDESWKPTTTTGYRKLLSLVDAVRIPGEQYITTESISFAFNATYE